MIGAGDIRITDSDGDRKINQQEYDAAVRDAGTVEDGEVVTFEGDRVGEYRGSWERFLSQLDASLLADAASDRTPRQELDDRLQRASGNLGTLLDEAQDAAAKVAELTTRGGTIDQAQLAQLREDARVAREKLLTEIRLVQQLNVATGRDRNAGITAEMFKSAGLPEDGGSTGSATASMTYGGGETGAGTGAKATVLGGSTGSAFPANWGAQTTDPQLSSDALIQSSLLENETLNTFDSVLNTQNKSRQLYLLFMYAARNAMSGDLMAMYEFMKIVAFIVGKDKANQLRQCGEKVMELQDLSRKYTNMLLEQPLDSNNPNASNEFAKTMTLVKGETDNISMSQKLILQICEEFTQVQELMTGAIKNILDANGRVIRKLMS